MRKRWGLWGDTSGLSPAFRPPPRLRTTTVSLLTNPGTNRTLSSRPTNEKSVLRCRDVDIRLLRSLNMWRSTAVPREAGAITQHSPIVNTTSCCTQHMHRFSVRMRFRRDSASVDYAGLPHPSNHIPALRICRSCLVPPFKRYPMYISDR